MPKGRHLKPDFFTDKHIVALSPLARLLYQGLWCYAADCGHLDDEPIEIKMRVLPADNCDADALLDELVWHGRIQRKEGVIYLPKLGDHARVDKRYETFCDACKESHKHGVTTTSTAAPSPPNTQGSHSDHDVTTTGTQRDHDADGDGDGDGEVMVKEPPGNAIALPTAPRADVEAICTHLADRIAEDGSKRPAITKRWRNEARLMLDKDERSLAEVHQAIDWCQADPFWRGVILSMPKLRAKYDAMRKQAQRPSRQTKQQETDALFERNAQRLGVTSRGIG